MDTTQVWQLLERGGLSAPAAGSRAGTATEETGWQPERYDPFADPAGAEELGRALAERAREVNPDVVLVWEAPEDAVLAFVVGRELGAPVVRTFNMDGLLGHSGNLRSGSRALVVADALRDARVARAMATLAQQQGASVVAIAALVPTGVLDEVRDLGAKVVTLASVDGR